MSSLSTPGLKIALAQREYFRYTGISADLERRGFGASRVENVWAWRCPDPQSPPLPAANPGIRIPHP